MPDIAAIFDVDRTLIRFPTERLFFLYVIRRGRLPWRRALIYLTELLRFPEDRFINKAYLQGLPWTEVQRLALACYQEWLKPRLSPRGLARLQWHRRQGHQTVLLTGSLACLIQPLQTDLQADWLIATQLETNNGFCTGRIVGTHPRGPHKLRLITELASQAGFSLAQAFAYADHASDLPLLEKVGHPIAVNPDRTLKKVASQRSWPIAVF